MPRSNKNMKLPFFPRIGDAIRHEDYDTIGAGDAAGTSEGVGTSGGCGCTDWSLASAPDGTVWGSGRGHSDGGCIEQDQHRLLSNHAVGSGQGVYSTSGDYNGHGGRIHYENEPQI